MDQRELIAAHRQQSQTLTPAAQIREQTQGKVNEFILAHQEKIVSRIKSAVDSGRFKIDYELAEHSSAEVVAGLKSNLEAAGYKVSSNTYHHNPIWNISWEQPKS